LLGGGRNLDFDKETTTSFGVNEVILDELKRLLAEVIAPGSSLKIDQQWSGIMAFGRTKEPIVEKISDNVAIGVRLGGMGVAIGTLVGEELAQLAVDD
jgi:gamma-glutamylputrescine oxidase